jgi:hypothetical protein
VKEASAPMVLGRHQAVDAAWLARQLGQRGRDFVVEVMPRQPVLMKPSRGAGPASAARPRS